MEAIYRLGDRAATAKGLSPPLTENRRACDPSLGIASVASRTKLKVRFGGASTIELRTEVGALPPPTRAAEGLLWSKQKSGLDDLDGSTPAVPGRTAGQGGLETVRFGASTS